MENTQSVVTLMESTSSKIQQLQKAFAELESQRDVTLNLKWKQLEEHFLGLENSLKRRFIALEDQEKEFQRKTMEARDLLQRREADVMAKEQASLARLEERRNAALLAISSVLGKRKITPCMDSSDIRVGQGEAPILEETGPDCKVAKTDSEDTRSPVNTESTEVISYPDLVKLCEDMDAKGLHKFISDNRKNLASIREEIPLALRVAADPASLVLNSLEGFYCTEGTNVDAKKDASLLGLRRTCIMLMECLSILLSDPALISDSNIVSDDNKVKARAVAEEWKPMLDALDMDASNGNSLEAHAYLQLIATFNITSDFDQEDISRFLPMVSRRRQTADLCRSLGLSEKMPGVIEVLVNNGRQIDAVNLAFAFELTEKFPPVSLLKTFLKEARKTSSPAKVVGASPTVQNEVNDRELTALKAVMKCIEERKLEEHYPLEPLQKRVLQLEKAKADKKRATEAAKPQPKRPRANVVGNVPRVSNTAADKTFYPRAADRYTQQYMYDRPYVYTGPADNFCPTLLSSGTYSITPPHGNYFASGYQYQVAAPYLH